MFCPECGMVIASGPLDLRRGGTVNQTPSMPLRLWRWIMGTSRRRGRSEDRENAMALHHATSGEVIPLQASIGTTALVKTPSFETIHLVVKAGESIQAHKVAGAMTLYCIDGAVAVELGGKAVPMGTGHWLYLDPGVPHALRGEADSTLLLTILFDHATGDSVDGGVA
jgi:quercetin dioxygenase-like cupin family protein